MYYQSPYQHPTVIVGVALALFMVVTGIFAPVLTPHDPNATNVSAIFCPPVSCEHGGQSHVLGTDHLGRDVLSRIVISFRNNLYTGLLGSLLGLLAAWLLIVVRSMKTIDPDPNMMRPFLGVPYYGVAILTYLMGVFLSIVVIAGTGVSLMSVIVCAGAFSSILPMALVDEYARWDCASSSRVQLVIRRGMVLYPVGFALAFLMGLFIESSLSFLGIGVPPPIPSLGFMIVGGMDFAGTWWIAGFPLGIVLVATGAFPAIVFPVSRDFILSSPAHLLGSPPIQAGTPAGFWIRLAAWSIDFVLLLVLIVICNLIISFLGQSEFVMAILLVACLAVIAWVYVFSPAKRLLGLFVLRPNGSRVGLGRRFFRSMVSTLTFGIGHSMIIFRQDKRGLHDLFADTVVVRGGGNSRDVRQ